MTPWFCDLSGFTASAGSVPFAIALVCSAVVAVRYSLGHPAFLPATALLCAIFQAGHFTEHGLQILGLADTGGLTLTWWARELVGGLSILLRTDTEGGVEAMHFFGDLIYTAGVVAWMRMRRTELAGWALVIQGAHQVEHTLLLTTVLLIGEPIGVTTLGGGGPVWLRILIHFTLNFGGTVAWAADALVQRDYSPPAANPRTLVR
jgi:hypothetical protein